jgi:hypothetical protein
MIKSFLRRCLPVLSLSCIAYLGIYSPDIQQSPIIRIAVLFVPAAFAMYRCSTSMVKDPCVIAHIFLVAILSLVPILMMHHDLHFLGFAFFRLLTPFWTCGFILLSIQCRVTSWTPVLISIIIWSLINIGTLLDPAFKSFVYYIQSSSEYIQLADQTLWRPLSFGLGFFAGALTSTCILTSLFPLLLEQLRSRRSKAVFAIFIASLCMLALPSSRFSSLPLLALVICLLASSFRRFKIDKRMVSAVLGLCFVVMLLFPFILLIAAQYNVALSEWINELSNVFLSGDLSQSSSLVDLQSSIQDAKVSFDLNNFLYGQGVFQDANGGYFSKSDSGYVRLIDYSGVGFLLAYFGLTTIPAVFCFLGARGVSFSAVRIACTVIVASLLLGNIKGVVEFSTFAWLLFWYCRLKGFNGKYRLDPVL